MSAPIAIVYHCLTHLGDPPQQLPAAPLIIHEQMTALKQSGLLDACDHFLVGVNGDIESQTLLAGLLPDKAQVLYHGLGCRNENRTLIELETWLPGHEDWAVLYFHSRGASHPLGDPMTTAWRHCMMKHCVGNWERCIRDLEEGYDAVGCHWMAPPKTPEGQYIFAGTHWWATGAFLLTLPPITARDRLGVSGIDAFESRYEAEVMLGNGPALPKVKDYHQVPGGWDPSRWATCLNS